MSPISLSKERPAFTILSDDQLDPYIVQTTENVRTQTTKLVNINIVRPIQRKVKRLIETREPEIQNGDEEYNTLEFVRELDNKLRRLKKSRMVEEQLEMDEHGYNLINNEVLEDESKRSQNDNTDVVSNKTRRSMTRRKDRYDKSLKALPNGDDPENGRIVKSKDWMRQKMITRKTPPQKNIEMLYNKNGNNYDSDISDEEIAEKQKFVKQLDKRLNKITNKIERTQNLDNFTNLESHIIVKESNKDDLKNFIRGEAIVQSNLNSINTIDERHMNLSYDDLQSISSAKDLNSRNLDKNSKQYLMVSNKTISSTPKILSDSLKHINVANDRVSDDFLSRESNMNASSADRSPNSRNAFYTRSQRKTRALVILEQSRPPFVTVVPTGVFLSPEPPYINNTVKDKDLFHQNRSPRDMRKAFAYESKPRILGTVDVTHNRSKRNVFPQNKAVETRRETTRYITAKSPAELNNKYTEKNIRRYVDTSRVSDTKRWNRKYEDIIYDQSDLNKEVQKVSVLNNNVMVNNLLGSAAENIAKISTAVAGVKEEPQGPAPYSNLMYDRRVIRGSNFAAKPCPRGDGESQAARAAALRRKELLRRSKQRISGSIGGPYPLGDAPPCNRRKHETVQTDEYLEELFERPPEFDAACQTDLYLCRPPPPPFVATKTGIDAFTEILPGELWDFDTEVQPILESLVGKTLEQALLEVLEDEELQSLREHQERLLEARETERAEARRLEEEERRLQEEKDRRIAQQEEASLLDKETCERVTAAMLLQGHIERLLPKLLQDTVPCGEGFTGLGGQETTKWLCKEVASELGRVVDSREVLEDIIRDIVIKRAEAYRNLNEPQIEEFDDGEEGEHEFQDEVPLNVDSDICEPVQTANQPITKH